MSVSNCTFNWSTTDIGTTGTTGGISDLNTALTYVSRCHDNDVSSATVNYFNGSTTGTPFLKSTATFAEFLKFDAVNIYYNDTLYFSVNATNAASVGFTPSTFFAGTDTTLAWATGKKYADVTVLLTAEATCFSTVKAKLYIAKF